LCQCNGTKPFDRHFFHGLTGKLYPDPPLHYLNERMFNGLFCYEAISRESRTVSSVGAVTRSLRYSHEGQSGSICYDLAGMSGTLNKSKLTLILLPGMDGTGELFERFLNVLPAWIHPKVVRYPSCQALSYTDLLALVRSTLPASEPFVVLAESFSTPIAIRLAAEGPPNLKALIICAGFIESPVRGVVRLC